MVFAKSEPDVLPRISRCLESGGVAILPGDTVYGFTGRVPEAEEKIRTIKGRDDTKPFLHLIGNLSWVRWYTDAVLPANLFDLWPGPLTLIVPVEGTGKLVKDKTAAIRYPDNDFLLDLLRAVGRPFVSTSVNRSGEPPMGHIRDIIKEFENEVDLIVDDGDCIENPPSTLLDISAKPFRIIRQGACTIPESLLD